MSRVQASPMWKNNMSDVQASMLPPYLKDRRLYDGTMFLNDPDACSPAQAAAAANTGLCQLAESGSLSAHGRLSQCPQTSMRAFASGL